MTRHGGEISNVRDQAAAQGQREPQYVYAESREEAQRLLDNSYLKKYRAVPVRWWRRWLHAR